MDAKKTPPPPPQIAQDIQQPSNPVVFKSDPPPSIGVHLSGLPLKTILASFVMLFLVGGVGVGVYLVGQQQQIKSRASNDELPENLAAIVPKEVVNKSATKSAQISASASANPLESINIPELESSLSAEIASDEASVYDFNGDNTANSVDLSIMYAGWGTPKNDEQRNADINKDGAINGIDYSSFLPYFNTKL